MEKKIRFLWKHFLWAAVLVPIVMSTTATNSTTNLPTQEPRDFIHDAYAWTSWGNWSPCSKTCGGGVSVQERQCLPRRIHAAPLSAANGTLPPPVITVRVTRQTHLEDCLGVSKRYHQCNNSPCPGGIKSSRAEQCAAFDRRPFRGRFYTWVPYIDGDAPCTLNCRPLGQHFYASLSLVADGTPCTRPGLNAICIQGACKVIGRETVLAGSSIRELRCGRRLVSGLFSRPRLELGYSYVTTVPRGACRLNISEIMPSENYIALKISNSSYIMNGEFAVSAPGSYDAAGARFLYTRVAGLDSVFALGPIQHPIDIMILYTQPKPSIKYEYFTESLSGETEVETATARAELHDAPSTSTTKHIRRHHGFESYPRPSVSSVPDLISMSKESSSAEDSFGENLVGSRKFIWKIMSYNQCTRSCGGGIQLGKYRCVESSSNGPDREVSAVHCLGSPPVGRRRRCGNTPCPPRWRATSWSPCPKCGPATRTRIVGCVQDHSKGITKISDQKCPPPKLANVEKCNIPNCNELQPGIGVKQVETRRVIRPREHTDTFREGPTYTLDSNTTELDIGPEYSFSATAGWLFTEWSECVGWCVGGGIQTRAVRCADPSGCGPRKSPESSRECNAKIPCEPLDGQWFTGEWSRCSSDCGGKQVRGVLCIGGTGRHLRDSACRGPRPDRERSCGPECPPTWYYSDWGQCIGKCTSDVSSSSPGVQRRSVVCAGAGAGAGARAGAAAGADAGASGSDGEAGAAAGDAECAAPRPSAERRCDTTCHNPSTLPPQFVVESQVASAYETSSTQKVATKDNGSKDCEDKLLNCVLAVQARLCHYNYYIQNCCNSCYGR